MDFLEKDLEQIIYETSDEILNQKDFIIGGRRFRQMRIGNYGIADLVTCEKQYMPYGRPYLNFTVYELKKDKIGISAFLQAINYLKGIKTFMDNYKENIICDYNIVLVGRKLDTSGSFCFLESLISGRDFPENSLSSIRYYTYDYGISGLIFKHEQDYNLVNKGF